jgi:gluconate 2-dehydrogenase gamma chain
MARRRDFLRAAAGASLTPVACRKEAGAGRVLTAREMRTLAALCDCIIPPDQDAGAASAEVQNFIDLQLAKPYRKYRETYRAGLARLDEMSASRAGKPFAEADEKQRADLLKGLENDAFFNLAITHTMQGYYGDPRHGGNRDRVSWRMLGFPHPPVRGRIPYEFKREG